MSRPIALGTAVAQPGTIQYGRWDAFVHPTGHTEFLPVVVAQGRAEGPCLWLTTGIHGPEQAGPLVIFQLLQPGLVERLRGTIVAITALSPVGLRSMQREPYHVGGDPNRIWPDGRPAKPPDPDKDPPTSLEIAYRRLFDEMAAMADYLIDYHNAWTGSLSFALHDCVLYRDGSERPEAEALAARLSEMLRAYGHTTIREFPADKYVDEKLHRSTSGAALQVARIPACTVELGTGLVPDLAIVAAAAAGTRNVMRWAGMLEDEPEPISGTPVVNPGYPVRRCSTPRVSQACLVRHLVSPGDRIKVGDPVAELTDVWGRPSAESPLCAEYDGFVVGRSHGIFKYPGDEVLTMAIRDEVPLVGPYPADYFREPGPAGQKGGERIDRCR